MDACVAPLGVDRSYFDWLYRHSLGVHPCGGIGGDRVSGGRCCLGGGGLWEVSDRAHILFKGAHLIGGEVPGAWFASVDAVEASDWAVA